MSVRGFLKLSAFFYILRVRICMWVYFCVYATLVPLSWCITSFIGPANSSSYLNISFCYSPGILAPPKKLHCMSWAADLSWQDIIGLQSSFHRKFNTWHTRAWVGQACRWRRRRICSSLLPIIVCGICKGHLQEALDMTSSDSICMPWLLCGLNITDAFQTTGATGHFSVEAAKSYTHR